MSSKIFKDLSISIILQARIDSSRLYQKIFYKLNDKSILKHIVERIQKLKRYYNYFIVAVPKKDSEKIQTHLKNYPEVIIFPGENKNILKRYYDANSKVNSDIIVRITGDNPLVDMMHLKKALISHIRKNADYTHYRNLPLGTGFEILNKATLDMCFKKSTELYQLEHVTPYIRENKDLFNINTLRAKGIFNNPQIRLTVDEGDDYKLMKQIYKKQYKGKPIILRQVLKLLVQHPEYLKINSNIKQKSITDISN